LKNNLHIITSITSAIFAVLFIMSLVFDSSAVRGATMISAACLSTLLTISLHRRSRKMESGMDKEQMLKEPKACYKGIIISSDYFHRRLCALRVVPIGCARPILAYIARE